MLSSFMVCGDPGLGGVTLQLILGVAIFCNLYYLSSYCSRYISHRPVDMEWSVLTPLLIAIHRTKELT